MVVLVALGTAHRPNFDRRYVRGWHRYPRPAIGGRHLMTSELAGQLDAIEIAARSLQFLDYLLWREATPGSIRYVARARHLGVRPYALVTGDLSELWAALSAASQGEDGQRMVIKTESVSACQEWSMPGPQIA
jgi:hypothetical protein